jgi:hypothetical protein
MGNAPGLEILGLNTDVHSCRPSSMVSVMAVILQCKNLPFPWNKVVTITVVLKHSIRRFPKSINEVYLAERTVERHGRFKFLLAGFAYDLCSLYMFSHSQSSKTSDSLVTKRSSSCNCNGNARD